ncbi:11574_t:CDS:2, partial [Racocetra fulgida]
MNSASNSEQFMKYQALGLNPFPQELLDSAHELADSFQESVDSSQEIVDLSQELLHDETDETHETYETHKGQDLFMINGSLPHINKLIVFAVDDTFPKWPIAEHYIDEYGRQKGFIAIKIRSKTDHNGRLLNLYYKCEFGRTYQPKKTNNLQNQHNKGSKKLNCDWKVNLPFATGVVRITSFNDHHVEHQLLPDTEIFAPKNRWFSDECREEIRHLVVNGRCDLAMIRSLISVKYPDQLFLTRDLANVVAQLQQEHKVEGNDASQLLKLLYEYKEKDPDWYIEPLIDSISNCLQPFLTSNRNTELAPIIHQLSDATNMNLLRVDDIQKNNFQKSVNKKLQFNKSISFAKRTITLQGDGENDNELDTFLKSYIEKKILQHKKEIKEREMRVLRENYSSRNTIAIETDNDQLIAIDDVANPLHYIRKGALKKNRIKGAQEEYQPKKKAKSDAGTR